MESITKILIAALIISGLMPLMGGIIFLFDKQKAIDMFNLGTLTPQLEKMLLIVGSCMLFFVVMHVLSISWIIKRKSEGFTLVITMSLVFLAFSIIPIIGGIYDKIYAIDLIKGTLILVLAVVARKKTQLA